MIPTEALLTLGILKLTSLIFTKSHQQPGLDLGKCSGGGMQNRSGKTMEGLTEVYQGARELAAEKTETLAVN